MTPIWWNTTTMGFILLRDSVGQELRQGIAGMTCLCSTKGGCLLEGPDARRKLSWGRGKVRRGGNAIIWRLYFCHLGWDTPKARLGQDCWLENLHMLFPYCLGFLPTWQLGSERKSPDSKHSKQGQQRDLQCAKSLQSCLTFCNPMDGSPPGSSVHGILQARILEWITMPPSRWLAGLNAKWKCGKTWFQKLGKTCQ